MRNSDRYTQQYRCTQVNCSDLDRPPKSYPPIVERISECSSSWMECVHSSEDFALTLNDSIWPDLKKGDTAVLLVASNPIKVLKNSWKGGPKEGVDLIRTPGCVHFKTALSCKTGSYPGWKVIGARDGSVL